MGCRTRIVVTALALVSVNLAPAAAADDNEAKPAWSYGIDAGAGYFNFRNSLYADRDPDAPGNFGDEWGEFFARPWLTAEFPGFRGRFYGKASYAYAYTSTEAPDIVGADGHSGDFDEAYVGWEINSDSYGRFTITAGRLRFALGRRFLLSDGYADGGSRAGYWSNPRNGWPGALHLSYKLGTHHFEIFHLDRDERPESNGRTSIDGIDYNWISRRLPVELGIALLQLDANQFRAQLDGATVVNFRATVRPVDAFVLNAEFANEDNGHMLDASAWYVQGMYEWAAARFRPTLEFRYAWFEGDDPDSDSNENFDPLFPGFEDWGTWFQGEIAGGYFLSNSNLRSWMLRATFEPAPDLRIGLSYFDFKLDQPAAYGTNVTSDNIARELDLIIAWAPWRTAGITFILANNNPGRAVAQAFDRTSSFSYAMVYLNLGFSRE